jgi:hypothetical protein
MAKTAPKERDNMANTQKKPVAPKAAKPVAVKETKPPVKTAVGAKKVATSAKKAPAKKMARKVSRGDQYSCEVCGLIVSVDETCGCVDACDIICCGTEMTARS